MKHAIQNTLNSIYRRKESQSSNAEEPQPALERTSAGYILYVEDNRRLSGLIADALRMYDYRVRTVATAQEAIEAVSGEAPALILLDLVLPDEPDGFKLYEELKSRSGGKEIPFIIVSGYAGCDTVIQAHEAGARGYFVKPFEFGKLLEKIQQAVGQDKLVQRGSRHRM